jgi:hypothetical protein
LNTRIESSRSRYRTQEDSNRRPLRRTSHSIGNRAPDPPSGICQYPHDPPEEQELAPNCHMIKRPPSGICEQLTDPPGEQSWHLTAPDLPLASANTLMSPPEEYRAGTSLPYTYKHGTPLPFYTLYKPTITRPLPPATNHSHLLYPLRFFTPLCGRPS